MRHVTFDHAAVLVCTVWDLKQGQTVVCKKQQDHTEAPWSPWSDVYQVIVVRKCFLLPGSWEQGGERSWSTRIPLLLTFIPVLACVVLIVWLVSTWDIERSDSWFPHSKSIQRKKTRDYKHTPLFKKRFDAVVGVWLLSGGKPIVL